jgi:hypothetical protein
LCPRTGTSLARSTTCVGREKIELLEGRAGGVPGPVLSDLTAFTELGLPSQDVGVMGITTVSQRDPLPAGTAQAVAGPDGILRGATVPSSRILLVRYA